MSYPIVNRRGKTMTWWAFNTDDFYIEQDGYTQLALFSNFQWGNCAATSYLRHSTEIKNNESQNEALHNQAMLLFVQGGDTVGPWTIKNGDHQVITPNGGKGNLQPIVVSVEAAVQDLNKQLNWKNVPAIELARSDNITLTSAQIGSAILSALATALSATGPIGAAPAGFAALQSSLLQQSGSGNGGGLPAPPNINDIKIAVNDVVQDNDAKTAATFFAENYDWFSSIGRQIQTSKGSAQQNLVRYFNSRLEGALDITNDGSFASRLASVRDNPDICKRILPQYILAAGLYLTLSRIHFAMMYLPDPSKKPTPGEVSPDAIKDLLDDTNQLRTGLDNARKTIINWRNNFVNGAGLNGTPEAIVLIKMISKHYFGDEYAARDDGYAKSYPNGSDFLKDFTVKLYDATGTQTITQAGAGYPAAPKPDPFQTALDKLDEISTSLQQDLAKVQEGGWPDNLLKFKWDTAP
jgi:hypothetical protein